MNDRVYLMTPGFIDRSMVDDYLARHPDAREEIERNVSAYGLPFLSATIGWLKKEELGGRINDLLNEELSSQLVELLVYPRDGSGEEFAIQYDVMRWNEHTKLEKAIEYERRLRGFDGELDG